MSRAISRAPSCMERGILRGGCLRTALRFQGTRLAIQLAGAIAHHAVLIDKRARHSIDFLALPEFLPGRADIAVALVVIGKVLAREGAVGMLGFGDCQEFRARLSGLTD